MQWLCVCVYQWFARRVQLVFGPSEQQRSGENVQSLSSSLWTIIHLSFPKLVLIKRRTPQESANHKDSTKNKYQIQAVFKALFEVGGF